MAEHTGALKEAVPLPAPKPSTPKRQAAPRVKKTERHNMRMYPEDYRYLAYWSDKFGMDQTEFLINAMYHYVKWQNQDYDLPTAEIQRLNQLIDAIENLSTNQHHLGKSVVNGFDAMLGIIRGDNYLVEDEDGELS
ncbi:hypothetical protein [Evansella clarkii]|uniref:hypothetical protein n=1 Tax=Evansella clarkii TaxID=79879 RepID=UPI00099678A4|nr:hypothetical protein [Evansella clarkii]